MIPIPPFAYKWLGVGAVVLVLGLTVWVQTERLDAVKAEYAGFVAQTKAAGDARNEKTRLENIETKKREAEAQKRKELVDAERDKAKRDLAGVYDAYRKLRDSRTGGGELPGPGETETFAAGSDRTCFDSKELIGSIRGYEAGILSILQQGDQAVIDLNNAKTWAQKP